MEQLNGLIALDLALEKMRDGLVPVAQTHRLALIDALGAVLAQPVISPMDVPSFDNAAMDGYAVRRQDLVSNRPLPVAGKAFAGQPFDLAWPAGTCIRIMTGAAIPEGCDAVIMQEEADVTEQGVLFTHPTSQGQHIRRRGEDIAQGAQVLAQGVKLNAPELAIVASLGIDHLSVYRPLRVAIFSTGDELVVPGQPLKSGQIYDTNRLTVHLMLKQLGYQVEDLGIVPDQPEALRNVFQQASQRADVIISSGGVSVGEADYTKQILEDLGEISFWKLAIKPGKPFAFGRLQNSWFCGLPGNPVSAAVTFYQLVQPLLARLSGLTAPSQPLRIRAKTVDKLKKSPGRLDFQRGILHTNSQGELLVSSTGHQGSHIFSSFLEGNCFIVLERERGHVAQGEWVEVEPFNALLGG